MNSTTASARSGQRRAASRSRGTPCPPMSPLQLLPPSLHLLVLHDGGSDGGDRFRSSWQRPLARRRIVRPTDGLARCARVVVRARGGYDLSTSRPPDESSGGASAFRGSASVMRDRTGAKAQWATEDIWFWPLPPSGSVDVSLIWPAVDLNVRIATFSGDALTAAAHRSVQLDADMRPIGPHD